MPSAASLAAMLATRGMVHDFRGVIHVRICMRQLRKMQGRGPGICHGYRACARILRALRGYQRADGAGMWHVRSAARECRARSAVACHVPVAFRRIADRSGLDGLAGVHGADRGSRRGLSALRCPVRLALRERRVLSALSSPDDGARMWMRMRERRLLHMVRLDIAGVHRMSHGRAYRFALRGLALHQALLLLFQCQSTPLRSLLAI